MWQFKKQTDEWRKKPDMIATNRWRFKSQIKKNIKERGENIIEQAHIHIKESGVRQESVSSPNLFDLYSEDIQRELQLLPGFIGDNLINIRYTYDAVLRKKTATTSR